MREQSDEFESALQDLLHPIPPAVFLQEYWEAKPLYIRGRNKLFCKFNRAALERAIESCPDMNVRVSYDRGTNQVAVPLQRDGVRAAYSAGGTICATGIERGDRWVAGYLEAIIRQLGVVGEANVRAYLSPDGSGFRTHFDARLSTTLQVEGAKRWRFSRERGIRSPLRQALPTSDGGATYGGGPPPRAWEELRVPTPDEMEEVVLEPGDVLSLPAGTWHSASAIGHSLALNVAFEPNRLMDVLLGNLAPHLLDIEHWRAAIPPQLGAAERALADAETVVEARIRELITLLQKRVRD